MRLTVFILAFLMVRGLGGDALAQASQSTPVQARPYADGQRLIDDFEADPDGGLPTRWKYLYERDLVPVAPEHMNQNEKFFVAEEHGNRFLRAYTHGEAVHLTMANQEDGFDWDLREHPRLAWDWRAVSLPTGGNEDNPRLNDTGLAVYVIFEFTGFIIKRPKSIKYTFSSTLPVGTVLKQDKLRVIVVANNEKGLNEWLHVERDVVADYRMAFGEDPPSRPLSIRLWSDSDNTSSVGEGDFDNVVLLP